MPVAHADVNGQRQPVLAQSCFEACGLPLVSSVIGETPPKIS